MHFSNVGSIELKTVSPNAFLPSFLSISVYTEKDSVCASDSFTLKSSCVSPLRHPMFQKPLETFQPFHLLLKPACAKTNGWRVSTKMRHPSLPGPSMAKVNLSSRRIPGKHGRGDISALCED